MWIEIIRAIIPGLITGVILAFYNRHQSKREKEHEKKEEARRKESLLSLEMNMATAKLSYALAVAVKRGTPNGEVEQGIAAYEEAKNKYYAFLNEQAIEHIK